MSDLKIEHQIDGFLGSEGSLNGSIGNESVITAELNLTGYGRPEDYRLVPLGGSIGDILMKTGEKSSAWTTPAHIVEEDNTLPITSAAVYTEIGNINALLATI